MPPAKVHQRGAMQSVAPAEQPDGCDCRTSSCRRKARSVVLPDATYEEGTGSLKPSDVLYVFQMRSKRGAECSAGILQETEIESILRGAAAWSVQHLIDRLCGRRSVCKRSRAIDDMTIVSCLFFETVLSGRGAVVLLQRRRRNFDNWTGPFLFHKFCHALSAETMFSRFSPAA